MFASAAIEFAPTLPGVDPGKLAIWGFSISGGHVLRMAALNPQLAGAIAHSPLAAPRGTVASLSTPDALNSAPALNPGNRYPDWQQDIAARSALRVGFYRPGRHAAQIQCPLLVLAYEHDGVAPPSPAIKAANRAAGQVVSLPGGHYEAFGGGRDRAVEAILEFLRRYVLREPADSAPALAASASE